MSFHANHAQIKAFGGHVKGLSDDAEAAISYVNKHLSIGYDEGRMFVTVVECAESVREALRENYKHLSEVAQNSGTELEKAATYYQTTDRAAAARVDATY